MYVRLKVYTFLAEVRTCDATVHTFFTKVRTCFWTVHTLRCAHFHRAPPPPPPWRRRGADHLSRSDTSHGQSFV